MEKRSLFLIAIFLTFQAAAARAQNSSQATMHVSATIVRAVTVESENGFLRANADRRLEGELGSITLSGAKSGSMVVMTDSRIRLANGNGEEIMLPVELDKQWTADKLRFTYHAPDNRDGIPPEQPEGMYTGRLITRIEYM